MNRKSQQLSMPRVALFLLRQCTKYVVFLCLAWKVKARCPITGKAHVGRIMPLTCHSMMGLSRYLGPMRANRLGGPESNSLSQMTETPPLEIQETLRKLLPFSKREICPGEITFFHRQLPLQSPVW